MSDHLRAHEALNELISCSHQTQGQLENALDTLQARWSALREQYLGIGADDVESELLNLFSQTEQLVTKVTDLNDRCQSRLDVNQEVN